MNTLTTLFANHLDTLRARFDDALAASGFDVAAIYAGRPLMQFLDDQPYPFKPNPHFKTWTPLTDAAECWIVYEAGAQPQLIFFQPLDYWHKPPAVPSDYWTAQFALTVIRAPSDARRLVSGRARCAFIGEWQEEFADWGFAERNPSTLLERLHYPRARKTAYELECMRKASRIGARGHRAAETAFRSGASEYEIHLAYLKATHHTEAGLPYPNIIALNENSAVLHYQHQSVHHPTQRRSFLIDAGGQFAGYASDITRTYASEDDEFAALIRSLDTEQQALCEQVVTGMDYAQIHLDAHHRIAGVLRDAGVITTSAQTAVESGLSGVFFPHGIGHLLGLQVHDVSGLTIAPEGRTKDRPAGHPYLRLTRTLEPGFVVTIEPGIYFIDLLLGEARKSAHAKHIVWDRVERLRPYGGIRIEDNVACTSGKPENLTRDAFATAA
jgi:Xaa-Pro dipeptidase